MFKAWRRALVFFHPCLPPGQLKLSSMVNIHRRLHSQHGIYLHCLAEGAYTYFTACYAILINPEAGMPKALSKLQEHNCKLRPLKDCIPHTELTWACANSTTACS